MMNYGNKMKLAILQVGLVFLALTEFKRCGAETKEMSAMCCDRGQALINLLPYPYNCNFFYQCVPFTRPDGRMDTVPQRHECPMGANGKLLAYDFLACQCRHPEEALCFDLIDYDHIAAMFNCSEKFKDNDGNGLVC